MRTHRHTTRRRLASLHARARRRVVLGGGAWLVAFGGLLVMLAALMLGWPSQVRVGYQIMVIAVVVAVLVMITWEQLVDPWLRLGGLDQFIRRLDAAGQHRNLLVAATEAEHRPERWDQDGVAAVLSSRLSVQASERVDSLDPVSLLQLTRLRPAAFVAAMVAVLAIWPVLVVPEISLRGLERLQRPWFVETTVPTAGLYLEQDRAEVQARETFQLAARDFGTPRSNVICEVRPEHGSWRQVDVRPDSTGTTQPFRRFVAELKDVTEDLRYRFRRDGMVTSVGMLSVFHPPLLTSLDLSVAPPAYTMLAPRHYLSSPSEVQVPHGSRLTWRGRANGHLASAVMIDTQRDSLAWTVHADSVAMSLVVIEDMSWTLHLRDTRGIDSESPILRTVQVVPDVAPSIRLRSDSADGFFPGDGIVRLDLFAEDDYGLSRLDILVRRSGTWDAPSDTSWTKVHLAGSAAVSASTPDGLILITIGQSEGRSGGARRILSLTLDGSDVSLMPGDVMMIAAEATDNRQPGPQATTRSRIIRLALPSAADLLTEQVADEADRLAGLDELRHRSDDLREQMAQLEREIKKDPDLDFARRQELEDALNRQQAMQGELEELTSDLRQDLNNLMDHNATSMELMDRMERVAELLEEVMTEELAELQQKLRDAMDELSEKEIRDAMAEVAKNQEEFLERLDRAIAQLEELKREQEMAGMTTAVEEMLRDQQALMDQEPAAAESEADQQRALADEAEALREQLQKALDELEKDQSSEPSPASDAMEDALREALEMMKESSPEDSMREAAEQMESSEPSPSSEPSSESQSSDEQQQSEPSEPSDSGSESQHEAMRRLASLYHIMMQGQQGMKMAMDQFVADALRTLAFDLLSVSKRQELVTSSIPSDLRDVRAPHLAREQKFVLRGTIALREQLADILAKSSQLNFQLLQSLDRITDQQGESLRYLESGWGTQASQASRRGLGAINNLVVSLLTSAQMSGSGGGGSCSSPSLSQQLEQMAKEQAGLNGMTEMMRQQMGQGGMSQEMRAQMKRLQADQQGLAGEMSAAAEQEQSSPDADRLLGDLSELARDMERVADDLGAGTVNEETLRRQERILSRMLDARNSVRRRDFSRRRESEDADRLYRTQQGGDLEAPAEGEHDPFQVRRDQVKNIPDAYRDLVRRYFKALEDLDRDHIPAVDGRLP